MAVRKAEATWQGDLQKGAGEISFTGFKGKYSFGTRMENAPGSNPEELLGAAHASCFSMALAFGLSKAGHAPKRVHTAADVHFEKVGDGFKITKIVLHTEASADGVDEAAFKKIAEETKKGCPVSQALSATPIELDAKLVK